MPSLSAVSVNTASSMGKKAVTGLRSKAELFRANLERHRGDRQLIVLQDFPDPDALSTAWTYSLIAEQYGIQTETVYAGTLSHQENIALVRLTELPCQKWDLSSVRAADLKQYDAAVFVDHQGTTSQIAALVKEAELPIAVIVDHHSTQNLYEGEFEDIRPASAATATIFTQYLQEGALELDASNPVHVQCATALMHGLRSETDRLLQAKEADLAAAAYISRFYDPQLLTAVLQSSRSRRVMEIIAKALGNRCIRNNFSISGVGYLRYEDRDAIPQAADFLLSEEDVHTAMVYGIIHSESGQEVVTGSLRTSKLTLDPDEFLKKAFGQDGQGRFFGGGRSRAGGFEITLGFLSGSNENSDYAEQKWSIFDKQIRQKLSRLIDPEESTR
ncbi:bifunctional oligoribonuclease/PAP phosphatase NrnA [Synechococcus sp. PCC 7336]|uniref:DHH family phosphoesterase n=1 Tax=Synechococcus sp. PCC 7336 TaxID=195250 RepID=UPI00350F2051